MKWLIATWLLFCDLNYSTDVRVGKCLRNMVWRVITQRFTEERHRDSQRRSVLEVMQGLLHRDTRRVGTEIHRGEVIECDRAIIL